MKKKTDLEKIQEGSGILYPDEPMASDEEKPGVEPEEIENQ